MIRPRGRGGVGAVVDLVAPVLGARVATGRLVEDVDLVHLHPSLRWRALLRDARLHHQARRRGLRTVVQLHGWSPRLARHLDRDPLARGLLRKTLLSADAVLAITRAQAEQLGRWGVEARVVPNPYDPSVVPDERLEGPPTVLFLGRLERGKGAEALVDAAREVDAAFVVAGEGSRLTELRSRAGPNVTFPGWVEGEAKRDLLARATVLALPSREEAAPLAVLEALAAGVPVVATRTGAVPELVGGSGLLLDRPEDLPGALREALTRTFPRRDMSDHHPEAVARAWAEAYR